MIALHVVNMII